MAKHLSFGSIFVGNAAAAQEAAAAEEESGSPMRILIVGDFRGAGKGNTPAALRPMVVDRDNLDDVLAHFHPALRLEGVHPDGSAVEIEFAELDDFHPDRLYERLPLFDTLRETHERLESPNPDYSWLAEQNGLHCV